MAVIKDLLCRHRCCVKIPSTHVMFKWLVQYNALWFLCWLKSHLLQVLYVWYDGLPSYSSLLILFFWLAKPSSIILFTETNLHIWSHILLLPAFFPYCSAWTDLCLQIQLGFWLKKNIEWKVMSLYDIYGITHIKCEEVLIFPHPWRDTRELKKVHYKTAGINTRLGRKWGSWKKREKEVR